MDNLLLKARIVEVNIEPVDINGFKYNLHTMQVGTHKAFKVLLPIYNDVSVGDCIQSTKWKVSRLGTNNKPVDLCIRVDEFELVSPDGFEVTPYLNTKVTGMFLNSEKCSLRAIGPDRKPFYMATLKIKDSFNMSYDMIIVAFGSQAKRLSTVKKSSVIECEVTIKQRKNNEGYEFAINNFEVKSEVN